MNLININRKKISSDEVEKFRNFQSVLDNYSKTSSKAPMNKMWMNFGLSATAVVVASTLVWLFIVQKPSKTEIQTKPQVKSYFINPPLPQCDIPFKRVVYYNTADTVIHFTATSRVEIKRNSLIDSVGNIITGPVEIRYREFMNPAEIFLSGIPMVYDSSGIKSTFESAGMIEIAAFSNNKSLYILPEKPVKIEFQSSKISKDYNLYYLDTVKKKWVYKGKDKVASKDKTKKPVLLAPIKKINPIADSLKNVQNIIAELLLQKPVPPVLANPKKWHFKLDIVAKEFPELAVYCNSVFEIDEQYKPLNPKHPNIVWDDALIEKANQPLRYYVTFKKDTMKCKYLVQPVLNGKNYEFEKKQFDNKFAVYQKELAKRKNDETELVKRITVYRKTEIADTIYNDVLYDNSWETEVQATRSFEIMKFGIWNCDKPLYYSQPRVVNPTYSVNDTTYIKTVFLADISRNALLTFYSANRLKFDNNSKNLLWMVTGDKQIAVFKPEEFKKIPYLDRNYTFKMCKIKTKINSSDDFIKLYKDGFKD